MSFSKGAIGIVVGILLFVFAAVFYSVTAYVFPTQAAIWMWVMFFALALIFIAPVWFWIGVPVARHVRRQNA